MIGTDPAGDTRISLAGQTLVVRSEALLRPGDEVQLSVTRADATAVQLAIVPGGQAGGGAGVGAGGRAGGAGGSAAALVAELARAGVPVTAGLAQAAGIVADELGGGSAAARAVASLAGRDIALSPAAAGRVAAALDLAGSLGPSLASLAARSSEVAAALPAGPPGAAALRSLLAPNLSSAELAVARIVQATQAAGAGALAISTAPSSSAAVIQNYVASQVSIGARLDQLVATNTLLGGAGAATAPSLAPARPDAGLAAAALQAALRGQGAAGEAGTPGAAAGAGSGGAATGGPGARVPLATPVPIVPGSAADADGALPAPSSVRASATAAAATGAASASQSGTNPRAAQAIADLATLATRFAAAVAPSSGAIGDAAAAAGRGMNATEAAQRAGRDGTVGAGPASIAGPGTSGDPAPLVSALRAFLGSGGAEGDAARLMRDVAGADAAALRAAIAGLPEQSSLQLAGQLLDLLGGAGGRVELDALRHGVQRALDHLGRALAPSDDHETSSLRAALERVATTDPRPAVAQDAARMLGALDGQQLLSRTASGADPGYVYFQVPMPDGRGAEVMVRRDPARRDRSFDEFNIAFLLDTERLGTLMIQLEAHPAGIRADVRTDVPALEPFLRAQTEALVEPLAREARRPVIVTTGVFDQEPPKSLLEPRLGLVPGSAEFYA